MKRSNVIILVLCLLVLGAGALVYTLVFRDTPTELGIERPAPPPRAAAQAPAAPKVTAFDLVDVDGTVEVRRNGTWVTAAKGERVQANEALRTGPGSHALLRSSAGDELLLRERVELAVDALGSTVTELTLLRGRVKAAPAAGTGRFQITSQGALAVAPGGSRFTVFSDMRGAVAVASEAGDVKVIAQGQAVTVAGGMQTYVPPGKPPRAPGPIPDAVFLAVDWPAGEVHAPKATLRGRTEPGTEVVVNGEPVAVLDDGAFEVTVPLREGKNAVKVVGESIDGKVRNADGQVTVDTQGPPLKVDPLRYDPPPPDPKQKGKQPP